MNLEKMELKRKEIINNLSEEELIKYIQSLTDSFYISFFNNDKEKYENIKEYLLELISIYGTKYNIGNFINYNLIKSINSILKENIVSDIDLKTIYDVNLSKDNKRVMTLEEEEKEIKEYLIELNKEMKNY